MNGYSAYTLFLAMKQHFTTSSYDYYRFNGKVRASQGSFEKRKDKYFFEKLGKVQDPQQRVLANMLKDDQGRCLPGRREDRARIY
jgi:hypothetical protein